MDEKEGKEGSGNLMNEFLPFLMTHQVNWVPINIGNLQKEERRRRRKKKKKKKKKEDRRQKKTEDRTRKKKKRVWV